MKIKIVHRNENLSKVAKLLSVKFDDLLAWIEEFLQDYDYEEPEHIIQVFQDLLTEEEISQLCSTVIEHFEKENSVQLNEVIEKFKTVKITLK